MKRNQWTFRKNSDNDGVTDNVAGSVMLDEWFIARIWEDAPDTEKNAKKLVTAVNSYPILVKALTLLSKGNRAPGVKKIAADALAAAAQSA